MNPTDTPQKNPRPDPEELRDLLEESFDDPATPGEMSAPEDASQSRGLQFLYDVPLQISVEVGRCKLLLKDLLEMGTGQIIELDKSADEPLDLYVNSRLIAKGKPVLVGDKFGIKLTEVISASDRIEKLG
ncbi:MAG: flagellar motor switch protein FliN [Desulfofustis sp.]|nr:flagellar motor switch protein FliN [Desulfofustis sp.]